MDGQKSALHKVRDPWGSPAEILGREFRVALRSYYSWTPPCSPGVSGGLHPHALAGSGRPPHVGDGRVVGRGARPPVARRRRTPPGSPAAQSVRRRGGRCECVCAARRWRRRETRREKPEQRRTSLRRAAMALHNPQVARAASGAGGLGHGTASGRRARGARRASGGGGAGTLPA